MTTYQQEEAILQLAHKAYEQAKTKHWTDVESSMTEAIEIINEL